MAEKLTPEQRAINNLIDTLAMVDRTQNELIKVMKDMDRRLSALEGKTRRPTILNSQGMRAN